MEEEIWVSEAAVRSENIKLTFNSFVPQAEVFDEAYHFSTKAGDDNECGVPLSKEHFPDHIFSNRTRTAASQTFRDIFRARGYMVISEAAANILRQFDLGQCALYPTRLTKADMATPIGDGWYCINYGNTKETIIPDRPIGMLRVPDPNRDLFMLASYLKDGQLAVRRSALHGPDIWVDPRMPTGFFVSGGLAAAIKRAKLKGFYLARCSLV